MFYCFPQRDRIAALVSGKVWCNHWLCMMTVFQSCLALAQSVSCGHARPFAQMNAILVQGEVSEFGVSPWRVNCIWQLGIVYCYVWQHRFCCWVHLISLRLWAMLWVMGYLIWADFVSHSTKTLGRVPVYWDVHLWSLLAFQSLGERSLCRHLHPRMWDHWAFDSGSEVVMSLCCFKDGSV